MMMCACYIKYVLAMIGLASSGLSSEADAAFTADLRRVYVGNGEQQRYIVLRELQRRCYVPQPAGICFQQKGG